MGDSSKAGRDGNRFWKSGEPFIWLMGAALGLTLLITATLIIVVIMNGIGVFWPARMALYTLSDGGKVLGRVARTDPNDKNPRLQLKVANRDLYQLDFRWISQAQITKTEYPAGVVVLERQEYGDFYGNLKSMTWEQFVSEWKSGQSAEAAQRTGAATFVDASGTEKVIPLGEIVRFYRPNAMPVSAKVVFYLTKVKELLLGQPREANTEGGLFPAIFGTVMMIFLMSLFSFPLGVIAGIYLREYAKDGVVVRLVRIAVNNLAGIPSIVYGIFGLGFFIYGIGGTIDQLFFSSRLPNPTFGTGGILWASLTLALLTVPVVIVSTEEAFGAIPQGIREGSLSLGATKFQTLMRILLPMASPGIMTGFILAMARAAGEVAPLMITGVVKLAPALPLDGQFPFVHLDRKFMHLGFHIYDIGFQSPNAEAARPMVFVTTLLLVMIVLVMSSAAIYLRNAMKKRYTIRSM